VGNKPLTSLSLFFTRGVSLQTWAQNGSLEREIALYLRLQQKGVKVSFITYGGRQDLNYAVELHGIEILCNRWNLPQRWYEFLIPFLHLQTLRHVDVIKTNQIDGADVALRTAQILRRPLIARCGFMWSSLMQSRGRINDAKRAREVERTVFTNARSVVVTTSSMQEYVLKNYGVPNERTYVIPNYVLTDIFSPKKIPPISNHISFVGRLNEDKNLLSLVEACANLNVELHFVGEGHLRDSLRERARELHVQLTLHGILPHEQLPSFIRQSVMFVLVSPHEGHPKSLLEAMSCGVAVLGADSPGIREQIIHGETGWLCGTDSQSIRMGIQYLLSQPELRQKLGENARKFIEKNYSLDHIAEMEFSMLQNIKSGENK
jgi:glycosyltransferase involved in cell wall biosynthesis